MAGYNELKGLRVKYLSADPANPEDGQVWYNSTTGNLRVQGIGVAAWISTSPLNTARDSAGGAGIQTAAMVFGGRNEIDGPPTGGPNQKYNLNEEYNGTGYSTGGALVQGRQGLSGAGTQTAGLGVGGYHPPAPGPKTLVEEYDGSSWSEVNDIPTGTFAMGSAGTQTAAVVTGGRTAGGWVASTYEYDGTNWTSGGALGTARTLKGAMTGTLTAALAVGGNLNPPGGPTNKVEEYNGTAWTEVNSYPTNINVNMVSGIQTSALSFGGDIPPYTTNAFTYDGTNFTTTTSMGSSASGQNTLKTATNNSTGLSMGGYGTSSYIATSEEYNFGTSTITPAAWSSGGALSTARQDAGGFGLQDAGAVVGGETPAITNATEEYDGSSWTAGGTYPASYTRIGTAGILTAGLAFGGGNPYGNTTTSEYDGSTWTAGGAFPLSYASLGGAGTQTAGLSVGGDAFPTSPRNSNLCFEYDGSAWTAGGSLGTGRYASLSAGIQTAAVTNGGQGGGTLTEEYDGSSWSAGGTGLQSQSFGGRSLNGTQDNFITYGTNSPNYAFTQGYDGSAWSTRPSLSTGRYSSAGAGTASAALCAGGRAPGFSTATEEFTGETVTVNPASNLSVS